MARDRHEDRHEDDAPERLVRSAPNRDEDAALSAAQLRGVRRSAKNRGEHGGLCSGRRQAWRRLGPRPAHRPAWSRQDHARLSVGARDGDGDSRHLGSGPRAQGGPGRHPDLDGPRRRPVHRRDADRLQPVVEESLYPAMEDFRIELVTGMGAGARAIPLSIERFTLVGATTRTGLLGSPLRSRFGIVDTFEFYSADELTSIVHRSARLLGIPIEDAGAEEIGRRARGTPRIANRLSRRIRDFADVRGDGRVTRELAEYAMGRLEVDPLGLDAGDRKLLSTVIKRFDGGPVEFDSLAASLAEDRRHAGVRLRALPDSGRLPDPHAARPPSHASRLRTPGTSPCPLAARETVFQSGPEGPAPRRFSSGPLRGPEPAAMGSVEQSSTSPDAILCAQLVLSGRVGRRGRRCLRRRCGPGRACGRRSSPRPR